MRTALQQLVAWLDAGLVAVEWNGRYRKQSEEEIRASTERVREHIQKDFIEFLAELRDACDSDEFKKHLEQLCDEILEWPVPGTKAGTEYSQRKFGKEK